MRDGEYYDRELEMMPWSEVQRLTFEKARRQIERVYVVSPHYRRKFDEVGLKPADIKHPDDLSRIPFFDKDEERLSQQANPPWGDNLCVDTTEVVRMHAS